MKTIYEKSAFTRCDHSSSAASLVLDIGGQNQSKGTMAYPTGVRIPCDMDCHQVGVVHSPPRRTEVKGGARNSSAASEDARPRNGCGQEKPMHYTFTWCPVNSR